MVEAVAAVEGVDIAGALVPVVAAEGVAIAGGLVPVMAAEGVGLAIDKEKGAAKNVQN